MKIEYYEDMLEQEAINKYLNMIANDYNGELAKIFKEKYINKDKEIERLNNIINELEKRIEKAIKYIEDTSYKSYFSMLQADYNMSLDTLINILKGSNKE